MPAVFIHGKLDAEIPVEVSETLAELAPHGEAHIMEESGHMPHVEQPAEFNALLRSVLGVVAAPGRTDPPSRTERLDRYAPTAGPRAGRSGPGLCRTGWGPPSPRRGTAPGAGQYCRCDSAVSQGI